MKIETRTRTIPAKTVTETVYVAYDGAEFNNKYSCLNHETELPIKNSPVIKNRIESAWSLDGYNAEMYYIQDKKDIEAIYSFKKITPNTIDSNYDAYGPGWYIFYEMDGDGYNTYLENYEAQVKEYQLSLKSIIKHNQDAIEKAEREWKNEILPNEIHEYKSIVTIN